ncbi:hypothetical protein HHK36_012251 [Tetracentron sinense]|uniref:Cytochrome c-552/DMSO reductase-like haem-binding domain-containing protein n=1 Tax=Tetracentron sinense TaxID=13715 RepID=A0A834ZF11_TETSI|nr:hypothetical protein HHK36_012251 [Tetracentron sinense]
MILVHRITGKGHGGMIASLFTQVVTCSLWQYLTLSSNRKGSETSLPVILTCVNLAPTGFVEEDSPYASGGQKGTFYFEFSRPLRTMDRLQQDVQFVIGETSKLSVAFWYPVDGNPWHGSGHYSVSCDWVPLDISLGGSVLTKATSRRSWDAASVFSLILSVVSFCISIFVGYWVSKTKSVPFTPMDHL